MKDILIGCAAVCEGSAAMWLVGCSLLLQTICQHLQHGTGRHGMLTCDVRPAITVGSPWEAAMVIPRAFSSGACAAAGGYDDCWLLEGR